MSLSRGGRGGLTKFLEKGTLSLSTEFFFFDGFPKFSYEVQLQAEGLLK